MSDTIRWLFLRFGVEGAQQGRQELERLGQAGDQALQRIVGGAQMASRALSLLTPILGALSAGALLNFVRTSIDAVGGLGELADEAGVTTDALQGLQFAATQVGLRNEELTRGLQALTRRLADVASGNQDARRAFEQYGIAVTDAGGRMLPTEQILANIADRIAATERPLERARIATEIFGDRLGQRLIPFLAQGRTGLTDLIAEAIRFGAIADADLIARADRASDRLAALGDVVSRLARNIAAELAPPLTAVLRDLERLAFGPSGQERAATRRATLDEREAALLRELEALEAGREVPVRRGSVRRGLVGAARQQAGVTDEARIPEIRAALDQVRAERAILDRELDDARDNARRILEGNVDAERPFGPKTGLPPIDTRTKPGRRAGANQAQREREAVLREVQRLTERNETAQERYNRRLEELEALIRRAQAAGVPIPDEAIIRERTAALEEFNRELARADVEGQKLAKVMDQIGDAFSSAFEDAIAGGARFSDILRRLQMDLLRIGTNALVGDPLRQWFASLIQPGQGGGGIGGVFSGIGGALSSVFGSIFHEGGIVGGPAPQRAVPAIAFAGAPRFHAGGFPGLRSDEVPAILQRGERVLSREEVRRGAGMAGRVTVNITTPDADSFARSRSQVQAQMARAVRAGMRNV